MYKVFIADDEKGIRTLLFYIIEWERLDMTLVGTADNGESALKQILQLQPDIVITDIEMYGLNGLTLIQRVQEKLPSLHFIIISGYQYFEYAHTAIKYGVDDFLIKPLQKAEINEVLKKISRKIDAARSNVTANSSLFSAMEIHQLHENFLNSIKDHQKYSLTDTNKKFKFSLQDGLFCFVHIQLDCNDVRSSFMDNIITSLKKQISPEFQKICFTHYFFPAYNRLSFLLNYSKIVSDEFSLVYDKIFRIVQKTIYVYKVIHTTISVGLAVSNCEQLSDAYHSSLLCLQSRLHLGCDQILYADKLIPVKSEEIEKPYFNYSQAEKAIELLDDRMIHENLTSQILATRAYLDRYPYRVQEVASDLFISYREIVRKIFPSANLSSEKVFFEQISSMFQEKSVWDFLQQTIKGWLSDIESQKKQETWNTLKDAQNYIKRNYNKKIGINEVANELFLSPSYFCMLFKKELGINFHDYLLSIRIDKAKHFLREKRYTIQEISSLVGYKDTKHFSRLFKKEVGLSPTEYRKLHWLYNLNLEDNCNKDENR